MLKAVDQKAYYLRGESFHEGYQEWLELDDRLAWIEWRAWLENPRREILQAREGGEENGESKQGGNGMGSGSAL